MNFDPNSFVLRAMTAMMATLTFAVLILILLSYYQNPKSFIDYDGANIIYWYWIGVVGSGIASGFFNFIMIQYIIKSFKQPSRDGLMPKDWND